MLGTRTDGHDPGHDEGSDDARHGAPGAPRLSDDTSFLLARANAISLSASNTALDPHGLKVRSYAVLALAAGSEHLSQRDLASYLRLDPSQVVALVDGLQARGLVERRTDPSDRRTNAVVATAAGTALVGRAQASLHAAEDDLFRTLDEDERRALTALLRRIAFAP